MIAVHTYFPLHKKHGASSTAHCKILNKVFQKLILKYHEENHYC